MSWATLFPGLGLDEKLTPADVQKLIEAGQKQPSLLESRNKTQRELKTLRENYKALNGLYESAKKNVSNIGRIGGGGLGGGDYWGGMLNPYGGGSGVSEGVLSAIAPAPAPAQEQAPQTSPYKALFWLAAAGVGGYLLWTRVF